jgi:hypothetical protein
MKLVDRAKNMIVSPNTEWDVVAAEATPPAAIVTGYVLPLAGAAAVASFIGSALFLGFFGGRMGIGVALAAAVYQVVMSVVSVFVLAFIVDALAPTFSGAKNFQQAVKLVAYAYTPAWVFGLLAIIPFLGWLAAALGSLYALYLLSLGLPKLMRAPAEKTIPYLVVVIISAIVLWLVVAALSTAMLGMGAGSLVHRGASDAVFDKDSRLGKLDEFSKKMEEAGRKMEAAEKSGDTGKQAAAAMAALGTAFSGGKGVEPVSIDKLKPFVPESFAGLSRTDLRTDRSGVAGLMVARAEATYGSGDRNVELEVVDTGGAAGLMGLASWMGVQSERETNDRRESTRREGNRLVHEEVDKRGGASKYTLVVADRFVVSAQGNGVDIGMLRSGVNTVNLGALEALR